MADKNSIRFAVEVITPGDFSHPSLGQVFNIIASLRGMGSPVDVVTVGQEVNKRKIPGVTGNDIGLWLQSPENSGSVTHHANIVRDDSIRRQSVTVATRAVQRLTDPADEPSVAIADVVRELREISAAGAGSTLRAKVLNEVLEGSDDYDWVVPGLLERRDRVVVTAAEGAGKTTFIRQMAVCPASGIHPTEFFEMDPIRVLVVDAENTETQWRRQVRRLVVQGRNLGSADPGSNVWLACSPRMNVTKDSDLGAIHRLLDESQADMVCVGPLYKLSGGDVNTEEGIGPVLDALDTIRERGVALVVEAHAGHQKNAAGYRDLRPRGSSALMGWPEFGFGLARNSGDPERLVDLARWRGDRDERAWPEQFSRGGTWPWMNPLLLDRPVTTDFWAEVDR
ncbi:AAA family ATPase [Saxibacter everestensis]|uniref:AAA family ATPase n=1 Tax=Saxibacter everestensis TaxID=2909229 RepID=A0ABY8QWF9_9MICO|nr:AAA family ATPase [Brevibacteriaceae bacterium ZFBP1038]